MNINLANIFGLSGGQWIPILLGGMLFLVGGTVAITAMYLHNRRKQMWHETARLALEKGQPLPPLEIDEARVERAAPREAAWDDIQAGAICIATGAGLYLFLGGFINAGLGYVGAIPGFIGVALVLVGIGRLVAERKKRPDAGRSSES